MISGSRLLDGRPEDPENRVLAAPGLECGPRWAQDEGLSVLVAVRKLSEFLDWVELPAELVAVERLWGNAPPSVRVWLERFDQSSVVFPDPFKHRAGIFPELPIAVADGELRSRLSAGWDTETGARELKDQVIKS